MKADLPVALIGAGPVGLAAAAHLVSRGEAFVVLEGGPTVGHAVRQWGHVRVFSPWRYNIDKQARLLLEDQGWQAPDDGDLPTGHELADRYLAPLAEHPSIAKALRLNAKVVAVGRKDYDKVKTAGRDQQPFELRLLSGETVEARAVIDASGTWFSPNPMGSGGHHVPGEPEHAERIAYGIPDVAGRDRRRYEGKRVLVVGAGHSAINAVVDLVELRRNGGNPQIHWAMRRKNLTTVFGGEHADALPARGALGASARSVIESGDVTLLTPFRIQAIGSEDGALRVEGDVDGHAYAAVVDEIIVATGFRPELEPLREVRLKLDPWLESAEALGPLIDPNEHSCGSVRPHGYEELSHPERDFYIIGAKSYGRAPSFLLATGYEQARSVVAALSGDTEAARRVELDLPETGVCGVARKAAASSDSSSDEPCCGSKPAAITVSEASGCCGGPAPEGIDACCLKDADAKAAGEEGCGCGKKDGDVQPVPAIAQVAGDAGAGCGASAASTTAEMALEPTQDGAGCCGGPAPDGVDACCVKDADAKAAGEEGCGCGSKPSAERKPAPAPMAMACCG